MEFNQDACSLSMIETYYRRMLICDINQSMIDFIHILYSSMIFEGNIILSMEDLESH